MNVTTILGTGGPIINSPHPEKILQTIFPKDKRDNDILLPESGNIYIDSDYILYAVGLLSQFDKKLAFAVLENSLHLKKEECYILRNVLFQDFHFILHWEKEVKRQKKHWLPEL